MRIAKTLVLVSFSAFLLFLPEMEAQPYPHPLCVSQFALVNYACGSLRLSTSNPFPPPNQLFPDDDHDHVYPPAQSDDHGQDNGELGPHEGNELAQNYSQSPIQQQRHEHEHGQSHERGQDHVGGRNSRHEHGGRSNHRHEHEGGRNHRHEHEGGREHERGRSRRHEHEGGRGSRHEHKGGHDHRREHRHGSGHRHRHSGHHHSRSSADDCCKWLTELDDDCVCHLLVNLPPFLSRLSHKYTVHVENTCDVTYSCEGRQLRP